MAMAMAHIICYRAPSVETLKDTKKRKSKMVSNRSNRPSKTMFKNSINIMDNGWMDDVEEKR